MDTNDFINFLNAIVPECYKDICGAISLLSDELENTKSSLANKLMAAQANDDFLLARNIIDLQETLSNKISEIKNFLNANELKSTSNIDSGNHAKLNVEPINSTPEINNNQSDLNNKESGYNIANMTATYTKPVAFSLFGKLYTATKWKSVLLGVANILYSKDPTIIENMITETKIPGRRRIKMSYNKNDFRSPLKISNSNIWVETHGSAEYIRENILTLLNRYNIPTSELNIYLYKAYGESFNDVEVKSTF